MKRLLQAAGVLALILWTGLGLAAWIMTKEQVHVVVSQDEPGTAAAPLALLAERVGELERDLASLNETLGSNFSILDERIAQALSGVQGGDRAGLERDLRARIAELEARLSTAPGDGDGALAAAPGEAPAEPAQNPLTNGGAAPPASAGAPEAPAPAASFLAFKLPSQSFVLDQRRRWTIVASLSRVGFDGKSSLHDFTGATTAVSGELVVNPARPAERPSGRITVDARRLDTGLDDRDEDMHERLESDRFTTIEFELESFEPDGATGGAALHGTVKGRMRIRGAEHAFSMPIKAEVDADHRLVVEGSAPLFLSDYGVPVPNKLGLVKMDDQVIVWVALRARPGAEAD